MKILELIIIALLFIRLDGMPLATQSRTFETRSLLLRMERKANDQALKRLFEEGEERMPDLIQALYDPDKKVNINAQVIIRYLGDPKGIEAIEKWVESKRQQNQDFWMPKGIENFSSQDGKFLKGDDKDLAKLMHENTFFLVQARQDVSVKLIAYSNSKDKALIEVVDGCTPLCGEGWHVSLKKENGKWRFLSISMIWIS